MGIGTIIGIIIAAIIVVGIIIVSTGTQPQQPPEQITPTVTVTGAPATALSGGSFTISWRIDAVPGTQTIHTAVHYGPLSIPNPASHLIMRQHQNSNAQSPPANCPGILQHGFPLTTPEHIISAPMQLSAGKTIGLMNSE